MINKNIEYLVGSLNFVKKPYLPFRQLDVDFLAELSKNLDKKKSAKDYPDIKSFSFWCRKQNIEKIKNINQSKEFRIGLGLVFHVTPSNIPTNFAYSLCFGLLNGNSNIIKVPSKKFAQIKIICDSIKEIIKKKKFFSLDKRITIIRYSSDDELTSKISENCDVRLIWGGEKTVKEIRKFTIPERSIDIAFADRYSFCVINANILLQLKSFEFKMLIEKFYNDTFLVDQNACSSPHLIVWTGSGVEKAKKIFWENLYKHTSKKYNQPMIASIDKYTNLLNKILLLKNIKQCKNFGNFIYTIDLKKLLIENHTLRGKWGFFYEHTTNDLNEISKIINKKYQTLTYFGFKPDYFHKFIKKNNLNGIDRIVPIGQALNIGFTWDGYDLNKTLSRIVEIR